MEQLTKIMCNLISIIPMYWLAILNSNVCVLLAYLYVVCTNLCKM